MLDGAACPCVEGYVCCAATQTCAAEADGCRERLEIVAVVPGAGPTNGGNTVVVEGAGFADGAVVYFDDAACGSVVIIDSTSLECIVPPGPPTGGLTDVRIELGDDVARAPRAYLYVAAGYDDATPAPLRLADGGNGAAVYDVDGDGTLDVLLARDGNEAVPVLFAGGVDRVELNAPMLRGHSAVAAVDLFGTDGRPELLYAGGLGGPPLIVLEGGGAQSWVATEAEGVVGGGLPPPIPIDIDDDGDVDLVGCRRYDEFMDEPRLVVLENRGDRLVRRDEPAGTRARLECTAVVAGDYDRDGDVDLAACGNLLGLWRNEGGMLVDVTATAGLPTALGRFCGGIAFSDFDGDGDLDLSVVFDGDVVIGANTPATESGIRIFENDALTFRPAPSLDLDPVSPDCRVPDQPTSDAALRYGARTFAWLDADLDGDEDLFLPLPSLRCGMGPALLVNRAREGERGFRLSSLTVDGFFAEATGVAPADLDGDGDVDLVVNAQEASPPRILRSRARDSASPARVLRVRPLVGERVAWGAWVEVLDGEHVQIRTIGPSGRQAFGEPVAHFGLGTSTETVTVRVWFGPQRFVETSAEPTQDELVVRDPGPS